MLVSILIPTRKRTSHLFKTLEQLGRQDGVEIIVMIDTDDFESMAAKVPLEGKGAKVMLTPPMGYTNLANHYFTKMEEAAKGVWIWIGGDDMLVEGDWLSELRKVPETGFIVQPEHSRVGLSSYHNAAGQSFPIVPRFCWKPYSKAMPSPADTKMDEVLSANGWQTWFLRGVTIWHDRPQEADIITSDPYRGTPADLIRMRREFEERERRQEDETIALRLRLERETAELRERLVRETEDVKTQLAHEHSLAIVRLESQFARDIRDVLAGLRRR